MGRDGFPGLQTELGDLAKYDGPQHRAHAQLMEPANYEGIESGLTFLGLCGLMDPPRPEVGRAFSAPTLSGPTAALGSVNRLAAACKGLSGIANQV